MEVPEHMHITASLMAGYRFLDGSLLEVETVGADNGRTVGGYRITNGQGEVLDEGDEVYSGVQGWEDYGEIADDLAAFLMHDADRYDASRTDSDDSLEEWCFNWNTAAWANAHYDELSMLANYREEGRL